MWTGPAGSGVLLSHAQSVIRTCTTAGARLLGRRAPTHPQRPGARLHSATFTHAASRFPRADLGKTFTGHRRVCTNRSAQSAHRRGHTGLFHCRTSARAQAAFHEQKRLLPPPRYTRGEAAIGSQHLKLEPGPKNTAQGIQSPLGPRAAPWKRPEEEGAIDPPVSAPSA